MSKRWVHTKLGDHLSVLTDYHANGSYEILKKNVELLDASEYAVMIRTTNFENDDFQKNLKFISKNAYDFLSKSKVYPGDILMNKIANAGSVYLMPDLHRPVSLAMNLFLLRTNPKTTIQKYVYFFLKHNEPYIKQFATGTAAVTITKQAVRNLSILLPPLDIQNKISNVISAYDDLIENNKRRIAILEKMAEEIYREWFVRMRFSSYAKALEDKPANQSKSDKGCPPGWTVSKLSDVLELCYGKALKEEDRTNGPYPVYGSSGVVGYHNRALVKEAGIIVGRKGNVGSIHWSDEPFFPIDTAYFVQSELPKEYLYFLLHGMNFINNDAAVPGLSRSQAYANQFFLPPSESISRFADLVRPFFQLKKTISEQVLLLVRTRDLLLPRLISGKLSVESLELPSNEKSTAVSSALPQQELAHA